MAAGSLSTTAHLRKPARANARNPSTFEAMTSVASPESLICRRSASNVTRRSRPRVFSEVVGVMHAVVLEEPIAQRVPPIDDDTVDVEYDQEPVVGVGALELCVVLGQPAHPAHWLYGADER